MKFQDIKDLTVEELRKKMVGTREELFEVTMKHSLGQVASPIEIRNKRRDLARMYTALNVKLKR